MGTIDTSIDKHNYAGRLLGGVYRFDSYVGKGGFGEVWRGTDVRNGSSVAIKLLPAGVSRRPEKMESLTRECKMLKELSHPHICRLLDLINDAETGPAVVMEFIAGEDIYTVTEKTSVEPYIIQLLQALAYLHDKSVMHLDIKPGNCLVANGQLKLIDFGLATILQPKKLAGTPSYMAPETFLNQTRDNRTDLYAVGVLWYYCVARHNPFRSINLAETKAMHLVGRVPALAKYGVGAYHAENVIRKLLARQPDDRFKSAGEVLEQLPIITGKSIADNDDIAAALASACGKFIGRGDVLEKISSWVTVAAQQSVVSEMHVSGEHGVGKTRLLNECKAIVQFAGFRSMFLSSADHVTSQAVSEIADALATPQQALALFLDNYDHWMNNADAAVLQTLLAALRQHPHPPTAIYIMKSSAVAGEVVLQNFTLSEVDQFVIAVANPPEAQRQSLVDALWKHTNGHPAMLTQILTEMIKRGQLTSQSGRWDASLFEDVSIDLPEYSAGSKTHVSESAKEILTLSVQDRQSGHALRALERIDHYFMDYPVWDNDDYRVQLLIEATECAISAGKAKMAIALIQQQMPHTMQSPPLLLRLAILYMVGHDYDLARQTLQSGLGKGSSDLSTEISIRNQLARCDLMQGHYDQAIEQFRVNRRQEMDTVLNNELGHALLLKGDYVEAIGVLDGDIKKYKRLGHMRRLLLSRQWRGNALMGFGKINDAISEYEIIVEDARTQQALRELAVAYDALARAWVAKGDMKQANLIYEKSLSLHYHLGQLPGAAVIINNIGYCHLQLGQLQDARYRFETALSFLDKAPLAWQSNRITALLGLSEIDRQEKQYDAALIRLKAAEDAATQHHLLKQYQLPLLLTRAEIAYGQGEAPAAGQLLKDAKPYACTPVEIKAWEDIAKLLSLC